MDDETLTITLYENLTSVVTVKTGPELVTFLCAAHESDSAGLTDLSRTLTFGTDGVISLLHNG